MWLNRDRQASVRAPCKEEKKEEKREESRVDRYVPHIALEASCCQLCCRFDVALFPSISIDAWSRQFVTAYASTWYQRQTSELQLTPQYLLLAALTLVSSDTSCVNLNIL